MSERVGEGPIVETPRIEASEGYTPVEMAGVERENKSELSLTQPDRVMAGDVHYLFPEPEDNKPGITIVGKAMERPTWTFFFNEIAAIALVFLGIGGSFTAAPWFILAGIVYGVGALIHWVHKGGKEVLENE